jgi:transcriptional regulator with XRE-family HTH domain
MHAPDMLKAWRIERGYSQGALAKVLQVSQNTFSDWENGVKFPHSSKLFAIELLTDEEVPVSAWSPLTKADRERISRFLRAAAAA